MSHEIFSKRREVSETVYQEALNEYNDSHNLHCLILDRHAARLFAELFIAENKEEEVNA